ncbi:SDR family oxidoreductase [Alkalicoccus halolimnae]|uniref:SDR family NAD(P)-dependent oxidoreductase n=1 Tax=Alkalicoccus halolimnae TaxID=1667239 RepID=A0AAJ8N2W1_9BACI|nr:SDR family NAD(P)-dependent oxidoreductase [Alkalicoccus halolimnae]
MNIRKQTAVVTGGTRGIGREIVKKLLNEGAYVTVLVKTKRSILALQSELGHHAFDSYICDVTKPEDIERAFEDIIRKNERIDILVNNAGVGIFKKVEDLTEEDWDSQLNTNLKGAFLCSQAGYRQMISQGGGQIVNIASDLAYNTREKASAYCASKWGLLGFSQAMNKEGRHHNVRVATVAPGLVQTDFAGVSASEKAHGLSAWSVAQQVLTVIKTSHDAGEIEIIIRP